ncbi:sensor histidine kinase [Actinomadura sp. 7K507]|nr:sensor histidine kinase [Actinomadura sp. 7K507]
MILVNPLFNVLAVFWVSAVALSPRTRREIIALCLGAAAFCSVLSTVAVERLNPGGDLPWYGLLAITFPLYVAICWVVVFTNRYQRRMWIMHQETHAARDALARLAVTEERLRFSRDLHDLLGHSLSLIAVKSELAIRMTETDPARAGAEMADVRNTAREALREVRAAVSGYREVELDVELAGARAVLEAAGIRCEAGELPGALPPEVRAVLAWVIREGTTNVIKHSQAARCAVSLTSYGDSVALEMRNDGASGGDGTDGSGLTGLAERVAVLGGEITAGRHGRGDFVLRADIPLPGPDTDEDEDTAPEAVPASTAGRSA